MFASVCVSLVTRKVNCSRSQKRRTSLRPCSIFGALTAYVVSSLLPLVTARVSHSHFCVRPVDLEVRRRVALAADKLRIDRRYCFIDMDCLSWFVNVRLAEKTNVPVRFWIVFFFLCRVWRSCMTSHSSIPRPTLTHTLRSVPVVSVVTWRRHCRTSLTNEHMRSLVSFHASKRKLSSLFVTLCFTVSTWWLGHLCMYMIQCLMIGESSHCHLI